MAPWLKRTLRSPIVLAIMWLLTAVKFILDVFGRADVVGDALNRAGLPGQAIEAVAAVPWILPALLATVATVAYVWFLASERRRATQATGSAPETVTATGRPAATGGANTAVHALQIEFGEGAPFEEVPDLPSGKRIRTVRVAVRNAGNGRLVNCTIRIMGITPAPTGFEPPLRLNGRFTLGQGEHEHVDVAEYVESDPSGYDRWPIRLCREPTSGAYVSGPWGALPVGPDRREYEVALEASAPDSREKRAHARLWADPTTNRLRMERI